MSHRSVYKSTWVEALDGFFHGPGGQLDRDFAERALELLQGGDAASVTESLEREGTLAGGAGVGFRGQWIENANHGEHVERVMRHAYLLAVELALEQNLPIETFWVTGAGDEFEAHICEGKRSIAVFMFIPQTKPRDYGSRNAASQSWVIRVGDDEHVNQDAARRSLDPDGPEIMQIQVSGRGTTSG